MDVVMDQQSTAFDHVAKAQPPAQRIQAQQKLYRIEHIAEDQKLAVATQNQIALHCARLHLTENKINQLQSIIFRENKKAAILQKYPQEFPKIKLSASAI
jgi:hypothetical protein